MKNTYSLLIKVFNTNTKQLTKHAIEVPKILISQDVIKYYHETPNEETLEKLIFGNNTDICHIVEVEEIDDIKIITELNLENISNVMENVHERQSNNQ